MDKRFLFGVIIGITIPSLFFIIIPTVDALFSIPPTPAFRTIDIENNATLASSDVTNVTAISYADLLHLKTDGSIILNITRSFP